jgi:hypothetical protein
MVFRMEGGMPVKLPGGLSRRRVAPDVRQSQGASLGVGGRRNRRCLAKARHPIKVNKAK